MSQSENPYYNGGGAGGGYLTGGSPYGSASGGSPGGGRKTEAAHSVRPLTVGQLIRATQAHTDAEWMLDDAELGQVTVVGQVISMQSQTTNCLYWLDDGTGRIEARHWKESTAESDSGAFEVSENTYARVTGTLKVFGSKKYITATHIRPSKDPHELYFHILEVITVTCIFERGPPPVAGQAPPQNGAAIGVAGASAYTAQSHAAPARDEYSHLPPLQRQIINAILAKSPEEIEAGVHVGAIARTVGGDSISISEALERLMDEGHIFSTIDDSHFTVSR